MPESLTSFRTYDVRFKTSEHLDGSDAMNPDPDYSAAYVVIGTDDPDGHEGHGFVFTCGRGNDVQLAGVQALASLVVGMDVEEALGDMGGMWKRLTRDTQIRWLGPEKGVMHMAVAAVINALWDLKAKRAGKPLWLLLAEMSPEELVDLVDFRYISDALTPAEALEIFRAAESGREDRIQQLLTEGYPAYTTSPGWLGYSDEKLALLCRKAVADGFTHIKLKVGRELAEDVRRLEIARSTVGPDIALSIDANQRWDVPEAIEWVNALSQFEPLWIEEPTSPDDVLGHAATRSAIAPVPVATGEHVQNRIIFKQLLQAEAVDVVQIDACRVGGVNENVAILLLAAKFGVKVCPHAGGVGLCEVVQHLAMFDFVAITGVKEGKAIEFVDHLHEHFVTPVQVVDGHYLAPMEAGSGATMKPQSIIEHSFPDGNVWSTSPAELVP